MKKKLVMNEPSYSSFPVYGDLFSILGKSDNIDYWLCNNFIQLSLVDPVVFFESYRSIFYSCPHLATSNISREVLKNEWDNDFIKFVKYEIDKERYIFTYVNRKWISEFKEQESLMHEIFIYGYDEEQELLFCADNTDDGKYTTFACPMSEVTKAYWELQDNSYYTSIHCINVIKTNYEHNWFESIKIHQIYDLFTAYKESRVIVNLSERYEVTKAGFCLQEEMKKQISIDEKFIDWRAFCVFRDHKKHMVFRFSILNQFYNCTDFTEYIDIYSQIEKEYNIVINMIIKYDIVNNKKTISGIIEHIEKAIEMERAILSKIEKCLAKYLDS